jgi:hypothetical protein
MGERRDKLNKFVDEGDFEKETRLTNRSRWVSVCLWSKGNVQAFAGAFTKPQSASRG